MTQSIKMPKEIFPFEATAQASQFLLSQEDQLLLSRLPFEGKSAACDSRPRATIYHGPPGAGKTHQGMALFNNLSSVEQAKTIIVAYDENGALFHNEEYLKGLAELERQGTDTYENKEKLFLLHRPDSQRVRSLTLNAAVEERYNVCIDITSQSGGVFHLINGLKKQGYEVHVESFWASMEAGEPRVLGRRGRVLEGLDVVAAKRVGTMTTMPRMMQEADQFTFRLNPDNDNPAKQVFRLESGVLVSADEPGFKSRLAALFEGDVEYFGRHQDPNISRYTEPLREATVIGIHAINELKFRPNAELYISPNAPTLRLTA